MYAITPRGIGNKVEMRMVKQGWELAPTEYIVSEYTEGDILASDGSSLEQPPTLSISEERTTKNKELKREAGSLINDYISSDITLTNAQINAYKAKLRADWNTTIKPAIDGLSTIKEIKEYIVTWSTP